MNIYSFASNCLQLLKTASKTNARLMIIRPFESEAYEICPIPVDAQYPEYEVSKCEKEWEYVERLLPQLFIPEPPKGVKSFPSGWIPQKEKSKQLPYYLQRSRNHMLPVYLSIRNRGLTRRTQIKNIHGDIWTLERELRLYLEQKAEKKVGTKIHEISGTIFVQGDHYSNTCQFFKKKGL